MWNSGHLIIYYQAKYVIYPNYDCRLIWNAQMAAIQLVYSVIVDSLCKSLLSGTLLHETLPNIHLFLLGFYLCLCNLPFFC